MFRTVLIHPHATVLLIDGRVNGTVTNGADALRRAYKTHFRAEYLLALLTKKVTENRSV
jgi:hypothetical protein